MVLVSCSHTGSHGARIAGEPSTSLSPYLVLSQSFFLGAEVDDMMVDVSISLSHTRFHHHIHMSTRLRLTILLNSAKSLIGSSPSIGRSVV